MIPLRDINPTRRVPIVTIGIILVNALVFAYEFLLPAPALVVLGFWIVLQLFSSVLSLGARATGGVPFSAHVGGFATGIVLVGALKRPRRLP
jgi:membrane associated rhomboid family serine protease